MPAKKIYILRTCDANLTSYNGFKWKAKGKVVCADWDPKAKCGNGLHGLAKGEGEGVLLNWATDAKWLVFWAYENQLVDIEGKCKVPEANVVHCGDQLSATNYILAKHPEAICIGVNVTKGHDSTVNVGDYGTATAGDRGTATAGKYGTATAGYGGKATAGISGTATAGEYGKIQIDWYDAKVDRYRTTAGYVGEDGIEANVAYKCDEEGRLVKA
jgi:hypothetical protein